MTVKEKAKELKMVQRKKAALERVMRDFAGTKETKLEMQKRLIEIQHEEDDLQIAIMRSVAPAIIAPTDYDVIVDALIHNMDRHAISQLYGIPYTSVIRKVSTALHCTIT